jgi:hypothetical protein
MPAASVPWWTISWRGAAGIGGSSLGAWTWGCPGSAGAYPARSTSRNGLLRANDTTWKFSLTRRAS